MSDNYRKAFIVLASIAMSGVSFFGNAGVPEGKIVEYGVPAGCDKPSSPTRGNGDVLVELARSGKIPLRSLLVNTGVVGPAKPRPLAMGERFRVP